MDNENFNPRPPCGGRLRHPGTQWGPPDFNPRPPCGGRPLPTERLAAAGIISIHGPRVGADLVQSVHVGQFFADFNPRPPCGGRRSMPASDLEPDTFQSTAPVWGPTPVHGHGLGDSQFQSTAPVWGPTGLWPRTRRAAYISIHGPRVGADSAAVCTSPGPPNFNPRPPCGGRRAPVSRPHRLCDFNPRPPCGGRPSCSTIPPAPPHFNPRPPCGGRLFRHLLNLLVHIEFQSTAPVWGPTANDQTMLRIYNEFQSTAPVWGPTYKQNSY